MTRGREVATVWIGVDVAKRMIDVAHGLDGRVERVERVLGPLRAWSRRFPRTRASSWRRRGAWSGW
jgi:hypothetical protein